MTTSSGPVEATTKDQKTADAIRELFEAAGHVSAYPMFNDGTELAPEVIFALECGMSTALVAALEIALGEMEGTPPTDLAVNMKVTAVRAYVERVVFGGDQPESEAEHADE